MNRSLAALSFLALVACSDGDGSSSSLGANTSTAGALTPLGLGTLDTAVRAAGLEGTLGDPTATLTLFAPTDAAFARLDPAELDALLDPANQAALVDVLAYHVLDVEADAATAVTLTGATTLGGQELILDVLGDQLFVNDARVVQADVDVQNGVIHTIDRVLLPPTDIASTLADRGFDTLVAAVQAAELDDELSGPGEFTVLAPTEEAFAALPAGALATLLEPANQPDLVELLTYHVVPGAVRASDAAALETAPSLEGRSVLFSRDGDQVRVNGVDVSVVNVPCTNGVIHVVDAVLTPPQDIPALAAELGFSTLVAALGAAELDDDLAHAGPFTVFAPTDEAFAALDPALLGALLEPANQPALIQLLQYHVVAESLTSHAVLGRATIDTLEGSALEVGTDPPSVDDSALVVTDVLAANGLVHAIDAVLVPPGFVFPPAGPAAVSQASPATGSEPDERGADALPLAPAWAGAPGSVVATWSAPLEPTTAPLAPAHSEPAATAVVRLVDDRPGTLPVVELAAAARLDADLDSVPYALVLDVAGDRFDADRVRLLTFDGHAARELAPDSIERTAAGFRAVWQPRDAGALTEGLDVLLRGEPGGELRSLRLAYLR